MVCGFATDSKICKYKKRNDEKLFCEDILVRKKYVQRDGQIVGTRIEREMNKSEKKKN